MTNPSLIDTEALMGTCRSEKLPHMSEEEFLAWLPAETNAEWVNGEVILMSPAALQHVRITNWLDRVLGTYVAVKKLGELLGPELMVRLEHTGVSRRIPDLLFLATESLSRLQTNYLDGAPDVVIEIVSAESAHRDWKEKPQEYEAAGVREYWIIDPHSKIFLAQFRNDDGKFAKIELDASGIFYSRTIAGFWLKPDCFWQRDLPEIAVSLRALGLTIYTSRGEE